MNNNQSASKIKFSNKTEKLSGLKLSDEWMDAQDMKQLFKVGDNTLGNWRKWGILQGSRIGRGYYYNKAQVQALLIKNLGKGFTKILLLWQMDVSLPGVLW